MTDPRLYLISPPLAQAEPFASQAEAAIGDGGAVACLLLRFDQPDPGRRKTIIREVCEKLQPRGVAVIVAGDAQLAVRADADGVHLEERGEALEAALKSLRPKRIVGVGRLVSRDEAMAAGESEPDYLLFGEPTADGFVRPLDWRIERVDWWSEIFNVPCVAYAAEAGDVSPLADAGADFVALGDWLWREADAGACLRAAAAVLAAVAPRA